MKFKFSKNLDYQIEAIDSVVNIFHTGFDLIRMPEDASIWKLGSIQVVQNQSEWDFEQVLKNLQSIQKKNKIESIIEKIESMDFSIEMETGTGKTYVYLRTIFELHKHCGLRKFIILVPSVAIREGVIKTIQQTREHFRELYNIGYDAYAYDSSKLSQVRDFSHSYDIQIMIMTIQSFNSDDRVMRSSPDRFNGEKPIDLVAMTNPVIIMDEPQNMESELSKSAIKDLNPLFKLRYSATHKEVHNLVYRLTPVEAYKKGLVKKIQVFGVKDDAAGSFKFKVQEIEVKKGESPKARVMLEIMNAEGEFSFKEFPLKSGDDLVKKTKNDKYTGLYVDDVNAQQGRVDLSNGNYYQLAAETENKEAIFRTQIRETIKAHLDKQRELGVQIKVLSLFFIDKVDNYVNSDSLIRNIFTEEFERLQKNYEAFKNVDVASVHKGYFASKKEKGVDVFQDTKGDSKIDKSAYDLIMKEKELLLSFSEPVSFIFSHSALKEGWDNPNIFQICTLKETNSVMKKRQEIGRGLRLPVDVNGDRIYDPNINVLTVVANESYQEYVGKLQQEFRDSGYGEVPETANAKEEKILIKTYRKHLESEDFKELWKRISGRTKYNLEVDSEKLIKASVEKINERDISNLVVSVDKVNIYFDNAGKMRTVYAGEAAGVRLKNEIRIPNIVDRIARETGITRKTVFEILSRVENLDLIFENPEEYVRSVSIIISHSLNDLLINEGLQYIPTGDAWRVDLLFTDIQSLLSKSVPMSKSVYERVLFDSMGERKFAESLENSLNVRLYTKLPRGFRVETPLGDYIPDWAIVWKTDEGDKLYLVRETKFGYADLKSELTREEWEKILCARKHFEAIGFDNFEVSQKENLEDLLGK
jgi:type III restriction enzyme